MNEDKNFGDQARETANNFSDGAKNSANDFKKAGIKLLITAKTKNFFAEF